MDRDQAVPGARVTWDDPHELDVGEVGRIVQPTVEDLRYFLRQGYPENRCVLVEWSGDDWDSAWHDPSELQLLPDEAQQ